MTNQSALNSIFVLDGLTMKTSLSVSKTYISEKNREPIIRSTRALFLAILSLALKDAFKPTREDLDLHKRQALHWIEANDLESFTSFVNICDYLDIDADRVRRSVFSEMCKIEIGKKP